MELCNSRPPFGRQLPEQQTLHQYQMFLSLVNHVILINYYKAFSCLYSSVKYLSILTVAYSWGKVLSHIWNTEEVSQAQFGKFRDKDRYVVKERFAVSLRLF